MGTHVTTCRYVVSQNQIWVKRHEQEDCWARNSDNRRKLFPIGRVLLKPIDSDVGHIFVLRIEMNFLVRHFRFHVVSLGVPGLASASVP